MGTDNPDYVSVIIPNLNSPLVARVAAIALNQVAEWGAGEVIVVGKDDRRLLSRLSGVTFIDTGTAVNPARARNIGAKQATGRYLCFLDADCLPQESWLRALMRWPLHAPCAVTGAISLRGQTGWVLAGNISGFHDYLVSRPPGCRRFLPSFSLAIRRDDFFSVGGFDERLATAEDLDLTIRLRERGVCLRFEPMAVVRHEHSRDSLLRILRHAYISGGNSIVVRLANRSSFRMPGFAEHSLLLLMVSPAVALLTTIGIFVKDRALWRHLHWFPVVMAAKLAWCIGASMRLRRQAQGAVSTVHGALRRG